MKLFTALRILNGLILLPHFVLKIPRIHRLHLFYQQARLPWPKLLAPLGFLVEGVVTLSLLANVQVRLGASLGVLFLLGATIATVRIHGLGKWRWEQGGPEYPLFLAALLTMIAVYSP